MLFVGGACTQVGRSVCVCVDSGFVRKIKIGNYEISSEMILSTALLVVGPI